ncbi:hypothetical protein JQX13_17950 [Archangium violaceum]|uniref:hypothetical protein n=1 Tax=Archangium violaceum TaxID=83451 RepID=UPI00193B9C0F|nr:hypothetical protein [Archangium violaceum]QRK11774.1 hypothetical protein JQX13_17950 [Archangium violaceum]
MRRRHVRGRTLLEEPPGLSLLGEIDTCRDSMEMYCAMRTRSLEWSIQLAQGLTEQVHLASRGAWT